MDPILQLQGVRAHKTEGVTLRSTQLMMPAVTLFCRCRGLPRASTHSPARRPLEVPSLTEGKGCLLMICTTARSETLLQQSHVIATVALGCGSCKCYTLPCLWEQISLVVPNGADFPFNPWSRSLKVAMALVTFAQSHPTVESYDWAICEVLRTDTRVQGAAVWSMQDQLLTVCPNLW